MKPDELKSAYQQLQDLCTQAADALQEHIDLVDRLRAAALPVMRQQPVQCWLCGDMDAVGHAKCDVPACGMRRYGELEAKVGAVHHLVPDPAATLHPELYDAAWSAQHGTDELAQNARATRTIEEPTPPADKPIGFAVTAEWLDLAKEARRVAMEQTSKARIPESGHFGAIAQNLDYLVEVMSAKTALRQQPEPVQEPIYQMQMMDGRWIDQAKQSYEYNKAHGNTVRIVYTTPPAQPTIKDPLTVDHGDLLTIAYLDGVNTGRQIAHREAEQEASPSGVLCAVEEAIRNSDCPFAIEIAFEAYEAERLSKVGAMLLAGEALGKAGTTE